MECVHDYLTFMIPNLTNFKSSLNYGRVGSCNDPDVPRQIL